MRIRVNISIEVNRIVKFFVLSDLFLLAGWGAIEPIFSVFIIEKIPGANLVTVGIAAGIYWILRSMLQVPIAKYLDRIPGEKDDFYALILGLVIAGCSAFSFIFITETWQLYAVQIIRALAFALYGASWPTIFSRHLDKDRISFDWTVDGVAVGLASGISGLAGGIIAAQFGYPSVFAIGALLSLFAAGALLTVPNLIIPKPTTHSIEVKDHKPGSIVV